MKQIKKKGSWIIHERLPLVKLNFQKIINTEEGEFVKLIQNYNTVYLMWLTQA